MSIQSMCADRIMIVKKSGDRLGPYRASVSPNGIILPEKNADVEIGDLIQRTLPNGRVEENVVTQADFLRDPRGGSMSHWELKLQKGSEKSPQAIQNINISDSENVQIGDGNQQTILNGVGQLIEAISALDAPQSEKSALLGTLKGVLSHPLAVAAAGAAFTSLFQTPK